MNKIMNNNGNEDDDYKDTTKWRINNKNHVWTENYITISECSRGVMVKAMDCGIVVSGFVLQSRYYFHFRANTLGKDMNPLILPSMG